MVNQHGNVYNPNKSKGLSLTNLPTGSVKFMTFITCMKNYHEN